MVDSPSKRWSFRGAVKDADSNDIHGLSTRTVSLVLIELQWFMLDSRIVQRQWRVFALTNYAKKCDHHNSNRHSFELHRVDWFWSQSDRGGGEIRRSKQHTFTVYSRHSRLLSTQQCCHRWFWWIRIIRLDTTKFVGHFVDRRYADRCVSPWSRRTGGRRSILCDWFQFFQRRPQWRILSLWYQWISPHRRLLWGWHRSHVRFWYC